MRTQLNRKGVAGNATTLAGLGLAMAFTFSSCSVSEDENNTPGLQVQCPEGSTWNASALACVSNPVAGSGCPANTTLTLDAENNPICVWQAVEISSSSVGGGTGNSSSSVGGTTTNPDDGTITVGAWTFKAEGDEGSGKTTGTPSTISITGSAGTITGTGTLNKGTGNDNYGYAMIVAWPNTDAENAKLKTANSISFTAKGDGKTYFIQLPMPNTNGQYEKTFTASSAGNTVTVCFNDLAQPSWGTKVDFDASKVTGATWLAHSENNITGNFNFSISNVSVGNNASCNGSTTGGTLVKPWWWFGFSDADYNGGISTVSRCGIGGQTPGYENVADGLTVFSGSVAKIPGEDYGFVGCGFNDGNWDDENGNPVMNNVLDAFRTLTPTSTISFKAKGNGKYKLILKTSDVVPDKGFEYYLDFTATATEQLVEKKISDFKQPTWDGVVIAPLVMSNILNVEIHAHTENMTGDFSLEIRDIRVTK